MLLAGWMRRQRGEGSCSYRLAPYTLHCTACRYFAVRCDNRMCCAMQLQTGCGCRGSAGWVHAGCCAKVDHAAAKWHFPYKASDMARRFLQLVAQAAAAKQASAGTWAGWQLCPTCKLQVGRSTRMFEC